MKERVINVIKHKKEHGVDFTIVETEYELGTHYVFLINGVPIYHSVELGNVKAYMKDIIDLY